MKEPLKIAGNATAMATSIGASAASKVVMTTFAKEFRAEGTLVKPGSVHDTANALKTTIAGLEKRNDTTAFVVSNSAVMPVRVPTLVQTIEPNET